MNTLTPDQFNKRFPIGTKVTLTKDNGEKVNAVTRSDAFYAYKQPVIFLKGIAGYYLLSRVEPVNEDPIEIIQEGEQS